MDGLAYVFSIDSTVAADGLTITVVGEIDLATAPQLDAALQAVDGRVVRVDLSGVTFCDGAGLRVLEVARRRLGDRMHVRGASPLVCKVAQIVEMDWLAGESDGDEGRRRYGGASS